MNSIHNPLFDMSVKADTVTLKESTVKATTSTVREDIKVQNKWRNLAELYYADGVRESHLVKTGDKESNPNKTLHFQIETAIQKGFDDSVQALLAKDPSTLNQVDKTVRAHWMIKQTGSLFNKIRKHVVNIDAEHKAEAEAKANGETAKAGRKVRTPFEKIIDGTADCLKRARALENPPANADITKYINLLIQAQKALGLLILTPRD